MFVVLCGSFGPTEWGAIPRPLTPLLASPLLAHALLHAAPAMRNVLFIYGHHLRAFNFEAEVVNLFPALRCYFSCVSFKTRGAAETALAGVLAHDVPDDGEGLIFLVESVQYAADLPARARAAAVSSAFIGTSGRDGALFGPRATYVESQADGTATRISIHEPAALSAVDTAISAGIYGFTSRAQFIEWARFTLRHGPVVNEQVYLSAIFKNMLAAGVPVRAVPFAVRMLGTAEYAEMYMRDDARRKLRICFDLDKTLVTAPAVPGDLSTVAPVHSMVDLARWAREKGHTIIVHTCRRAADEGTGGNAGSDAGTLTVDTCALTVATLERFAIPFDELIFGKPAADVYIDDSAVNPYTQSVRTMGIPYGPLHPTIDLTNKLPNNKYNSIVLRDGRVVKTGPERFMSGEAHFYERAMSLPVRGLFPTFFGAVRSDADAEDGSPQLEMTLEYVAGGIPLSLLLNHRLVERYHLELLFSDLAALHGCKGVAVTASTDALQRHYKEKLVKRFAVAGVYTAPGAAAALSEILARVDSYLASGPRVVGVVHGDCWFANLLLSPANNFKFLDMRGRLADELSLNGDPLYDYAKIAQSLLGFDEAVFDFPRLPDTYRLDLVRAFAGCVRATGARGAHVLDISICLMAGSLHAYDEAHTRDAIWRLVEGLLRPATPADAALVAALCEE